MIKIFIVDRLGDRSESFISYFKKITLQFELKVIYGKYGKHPKEALFYSHALPLPGFLLLYQDISHHWSVLMSSTPVTVPVLETQVCVMAMVLFRGAIF